jgi:hypothetical protein
MRVRLRLNKRLEKAASQVEQGFYMTRLKSDAWFRNHHNRKILRFTRELMLKRISELEIERTSDLDGQVFKGR